MKRGFRIVNKKVLTSSLALAFLLLNLVSTSGANPSRPAPPADVLSFLPASDAVALVMGRFGAGIVSAGMALSIPLSVLTSRKNLGARARSAGFFLTPEEIKLPEELLSLRSHLKIHELTGDNSPRRPHAGLAESVLDPYVNAIHVSLLREKELNPVYAEQFAKLGVGSARVQTLGKKLLSEGPEKLSADERLSVMADQRALVWLHQQSWQRPNEMLAPWWRAAILEYSRRD